MKDCLFCQIANGDKEELIWENETAAAFYDINPKAPLHVLIVPKRHIENLDDLDDPELAGNFLLAVREVAARLSVAGNYQLKAHIGQAAGQEIDHLHFHLLSQKVQ